MPGASRRPLVVRTTASEGKIVAGVSTVTRGGRERHRRTVTQTISAMRGDPLAQNVHVGKASKNVNRIKL